ncbi:MAG: hypothetical protein INH41_03855 [Myxococcaceae bacterium]|nr:hypothetical protein [Myxococcaceae bacterium]MCA3011515.1 hypothetical protein [Myxococcaceae bacterium]
MSGSLEYRLSDRLTFAAAAGGIVAGQLVGADARYDFRAGAVGSASLSVLALEQGRFTPFLMLAGSLAVSGVAAAPTTYWAVDARVSVTVGYTFFDRFTPYAVGRLFGGPVFWRGQAGSDLYHYQVGAGLVVGLPFGLDLSAEVAPLGEQRVTAGLGVSF